MSQLSREKSPWEHSVSAKGQFAQGVWDKADPSGQRLPEHSRAFYSPLADVAEAPTTKGHTGKGQKGRQPAWFCGQRRDSSICIVSSGQMGHLLPETELSHRVKQMWLP